MWWLALTAAQGILQAQGEKKNADAANKAQRRFERLNAQFANEDLMQSYVALSARRLQDRHQLARSLDDVTLDATRRIGSVSVASGESGLSGNSAAALINDFKITQLKSQVAIMDTEKYMQEQYQRDVDAARTQRDSRVAMGKQQRVPPPNYLQIAVNAATTYMQMQEQSNQANTYQGNKITNGSVPQLQGGGGIPANSPNSGLDLPTF